MYKKVMKEIVAAKVCPFCPEHFKWHTKPILRREKGWLITESFNPYPNTAYHLLIIGEKHRERFEELKPRDWETIVHLVKWAINKFSISGGGLTMRFGDSTYTGATVTHLHLHLLVPKLKNGKAKVVSFPIG
jgi:diadenosine tetraphosphate (Ap4A) HIT family hydrolase